MRKPLFALSLLFFLVSCGQEGKNEIRGAGGDAATLQLLSFEDYVTLPALEKFEAETGIKVEVIAFETLNEMRGILRNRRGQIDVIISDGPNIYELGQSRQLAELDESKLPNISNLDARFCDLSFDRRNRYSIPYLWGSTLIAYREDLVEEPDSWADLWDPRFSGKVGMLDEPLDSVGSAMILLGYSPNSIVGEELDHAREKLMEQVAQVNPKCLSIDEIRDGLVSGEVAISMCYSGDAPLAAEENENIRWVIPSEGAVLWVDNFAIPRDSPRIDAAHKFLDFMMGAEVAAKNSEELYFASPNTEATKLLVGSDILDDKAIYPPEDVMARCEFIDAQNLAQRRAEFIRITDAVRRQGGGEPGPGEVPDIRE
ncbi:MAG: spermidine/putrescine ABC transporter substrate-binding protein [Verrucomicrobiales bacterium]